MTAPPPLASAAPDADYRHLDIPGKPGAVLSNRGWESPARHRLRRWIAALPPLRSAVAATGRVGSWIAAASATLAGLPEEEATNRKYAELLARNLDTAHEAGSGYGSADAIAELTTALHYARILEGDHARDQTGTVETAQCHEALFAQLAASDPSITRCLNFGVSYAYADARLALRFPQVEFVGLDRSPLTRALNEVAFGATAHNLRFVADDVFRLLNAQSWENAVFVHARTLVQLPTAFIERLYGAVQRAGFAYVLVLEPVGWSRETGRPFAFSDQPRASVLFRDNLFLHNYPGLLRAAGFAVTRSELVRTSHPHEDYRLLCLSAQRWR